MLSSFEGLIILNLTFSKLSKSCTKVNLSWGSNYRGNKLYGVQISFSEGFAILFGRFPNCSARNLLMEEEQFFHLRIEFVELWLNNPSWCSKWVSTVKIRMKFLFYFSNCKTLNIWKNIEISYICTFCLLSRILLNLGVWWKFDSHHFFRVRCFVCSTFFFAPKIPVSYVQRFLRVWTRDVF